MLSRSQRHTHTSASDSRLRSCVVSVGLPQPLRSDCVSHSLCARHAWSGKACTQASRQDTHAPWTRRDLEGGGVRLSPGCQAVRCCQVICRAVGHVGTLSSSDLPSLVWFVCFLPLFVKFFIWVGGETASNTPSFP